MIEGIIYRYKSPSGKYYIGQTTDESSRRSCFFNLNVRYGGYKIDRARKKYGPGNFEYTVLMKVTGDNIDEVKSYLNTLEIGFIKMYDSFKNGYNSTIGGDSLTGYEMTEEHRQKLSESHKGKHPSAETNEKRRKSLTGKKHNMSEDGKKRLRERMMGNTLSLGRKHTVESIEKMRSVQKKSEETKQKISNSLMGHKSSIKGKHKVMNPDGTYHYE